MRFAPFHPSNHSPFLLIPFCDLAGCLLPHPLVGACNGALSHVKGMACQRWWATTCLRVQSTKHFMPPRVARTICTCPTASYHILLILSQETHGSWVAEEWHGVVVGGCGSQTGRLDAATICLDPCAGPSLMEGRGRGQVGCCSSPRPLCPHLRGEEREL